MSGGEVKMSDNQFFCLSKTLLFFLIKGVLALFRILENVCAKFYHNWMSSLHVKSLQTNEQINSHLHL